MAMTATTAKHSHDRVMVTCPPKNQRQDFYLQRIWCGCCDAANEVYIRKGQRRHRWLRTVKFPCHYCGKTLRA